MKKSFLFYEVDETTCKVYQAWKDDLVLACRVVKSGVNDPWVVDRTSVDEELLGDIGLDSVEEMEQHLQVNELYALWDKLFGGVTVH
ncbi:MAG: hypothetical protein RMK81_11265 [Geminicoccaceae bacterium]|nr:hypothetical protein [Geminicoccaceae bacterium]